MDGTAPGGGAAVGGDAPAVRARRRACGPSGDVIVTMRDHAALAHRRSFVVVCELRSFGEEKDGDVSSPACVRFSPTTRPLIAAPRHEPARHGIQRRRLNALPDRPRAPRAPRPRGSPRSPRRDRRPPRILVLGGRCGVRGGSSRRGRQGVHPRRGRVRRAPRRGPRVRRAQRARCASTIPLGSHHPHATHTRTVGAHLNRITKRNISCHPLTPPRPPSLPASPKHRGRARRRVQPRQRPAVRRLRPHRPGRRREIRRGPTPLQLHGRRDAQGETPGR